jgi:hypothetical protein
LNIIIAVFFLLFNSFSLYGNNPLPPLNELNEKFDSFNSFLIPDSLNQLRISSTANDFYFSLSLNQIPLYSLFDGNYNFTFLKNYLFENNFMPYFNYDSLNILKDTLITNIFLYSGNKNGLLNGFHFGKKKNYFWKFNPIFESSGGYYYSKSTKEKPFNVEFLENSAYQNIGINSEFGFEGKRSMISLATSLNISKLYIPPNSHLINDLKKHFNDYNEYIIEVKFVNIFENDISLNGNIFAKKIFRNLGSTVDSNVIKFGEYITNFEIDEYAYGGNLFVTLPIFPSQKNTIISFLYYQNVFLYTDFLKFFRNRTESENIELSLVQSFNISNNLNFNLESKLKGRAILYSELGTSPANCSSFDNKISLNYNFSNFNQLTLLLKNYSFFPFVSQYYNFTEKKFSHHSLQDEKWYSLCLTYENIINNNFNLKLEFQSNYGKDIFTYNPELLYSTQNINYDNLKNLSSAIKLFYKSESLTIQNNFTYFFKLDYDEKIKNNPNYKLPKFADNFLLSYLLDYGITSKININYLANLDIFDTKMNKINSNNNIFLVDIIFKKDFSNQNFFFTLNNILNKYYELQSGFPEAGLNFQLGVELNF